MNNIPTEMIFGSPGCGKTTYLIKLLQELLKENEPDKIAFVSFTKKGSYQGRDYAIEKFNFKEEDFPYFRTIHSIAFRHLGMSRYDMVSKKNYKDFSKVMGMNFVGYYTEDFINNDDQLLFYNSLLKNNPKKAEKFMESIDIKKANFVVKNYARYKQEIGIKDFDDLIIDFIKDNKALPVDIAIIDEAQDLTSLQWEFCKIAFRDCKQIYIAGDDDQAIYEWSGADLEQFLSLTKDSNITILDKSYRLKEDILKLSKKITNQISNRVNKNFNSVNSGGGIFFHNSIEDITLNSEESYYFLSRNNYFLTEMKKYLMRKGLLFFHKNALSIKPSTYNAIKLHEQYRKNYPSEFNRKEVVRELLRKDLPDLDVPWFKAFNLEIEEENYFRELFKNKSDFKNSKITLSTIHGVKGGEADNVILKLDMTKSVFASYSGSKENFESEMRCLYVGMTRAKKNLHIIFANSKFGYNNTIQGII